MQFSITEVVKTKNNTFYVEWDMTPGSGESVDDWKFQIHWAFDPASGFLPVTDENDDPIEIDGAVGPLVYDHQHLQYDFNKDRYYKVLAIFKADEDINFFSSIVYIGMYSDGHHETMRHAEETLYSMYHGEPCIIIKRKSFGARCPTCWSVQRQQRTKTHCDTCNGTGYVVGYYQPIIIQISFDSDPKKVDSQKEWENVYDTKRARLSNYPLVRSKDLIVNQDDNKRYVISHVETTKLPRVSQDAQILSKQNYILSQLLTLEELNPDDNEYFIDTDNIPEIPLSDEGQTGSTLPFFNDHMPATVDAPLEIDNGQQHIVLNYSTDDFELVSGALALKNSTGSLGTEVYEAAEVIPTALKVVAVNDDGKIILADHMDITHLNRVVGVSLSAAAIGNQILVQKFGRLVYSGWNWTIGRSIFFNSDSDLVQDPQATAFWMIVAKPVQTDRIEIHLRVPVMRAE